MEKGMPMIPLTQGKFALVDEEDWEWLQAMTPWHICANYARRLRRRGLGSRKQQHYYMHRIVINAPDDRLVDHINGNTLDNRKSNLRQATSQENNRNRMVSASNTSGYKGVCWHKVARKWQVEITVGGRQIYLGLFLSREGAARAYNEAALAYFGEFAKINEGV